MAIALPQLPKKNEQREAKFGLYFRKWVEKYWRITSTFELKDTRGAKSLRFSEVKEEQRLWGRAICGEKGAFMRIEPLVKGMPDYAFFRRCPAYVVVKYPEFFCLITLETFEFEQSRSKKPSLSEQRARDIAVTIVEI